MVDPLTDALKNSCKTGGLFIYTPPLDQAVVIKMARKVLDRVRVSTPRKKRTKRTMRAIVKYNKKSLWFYIFTHGTISS